MFVFIKNNAYLFYVYYNACKLEFKKRPLSLDLWLYLRKCMRKNIPKAFHSSYLRKMPCNCDIARSTHYGGFVGSPLRNIILSIDV